MRKGTTRDGRPWGPLLLRGRWRGARESKAYTKGSHYRLKGSEAAMPGCRHKPDGGSPHYLLRVCSTQSFPSRLSPSVPGHVSVLAASRSGWKVGTG